MTGRFRIIGTPLPDLKVIERSPIHDSRGFLDRLFCAEEMQALLRAENVVQINHTLTLKRGTVRGLHFQRPPHAEIKFVTCLRGEVFDVAVDLRHDSATFLRWHAEKLEGRGTKMLFIPRGLAHGFQALTNDCEMLYFHSAAYRQDAEGGLNPSDPLLDIRWPEAITELSSRDASHPLITPTYRGL